MGSSAGLRVDDVPFPGPGHRLREEAFALAAAGELTPIIGAALPLSETAAAHRAFEQRTTVGKTVLTP